MMLVSDRTRAGCSIAIVCAIIPPIETPTTWAESMPRWSSRRDGVAGHVAHGVRRPDLQAGERPDQLVAADPARDRGGAAGVAVVVA